MTFSDLATTTTSAISDSVDNIFELVGTNLPAILTILSITIGLPFVVKLFRRFAK